MDEQDKTKKEDGKEHPADESQLPIPPEIMNEIPPEIRPRLKQEISMFMAGFQGRVPPPNPLLGKITESHIDKIIDSVENDGIREANADTSTRRYFFAGFVIVLLVAIVMVVFLEMRQSTALLVNLIIAVFSFAGGFGTGKFFQK